VRPILNRRGNCIGLKCITRKRRDAVGAGAQEGQQTGLFAYSSAKNRSGKLMDVVDHINSKYRRSTIH
jgi:hypothetical protein